MSTTHFYCKPLESGQSGVGGRVNPTEEGDYMIVLEDDVDVNEILKPTKTTKRKFTQDGKPKPQTTKPKAKKLKPDQEVQRWIKNTLQHIDNFDPESGYYSTHTSQDGDDVPTLQQVKDEFDGIADRFDNIYEANENEPFEPYIESNIKGLTVGMQWPNVYEARGFMRNFGIRKRFIYKHVKNDSTRKGSFQHVCEGNTDRINKLANTQWAATEIEELVRDVTTLTPKSVAARIKKKCGVVISYYTAWNAKTICLEKIVGSYDEGYNSNQPCILRYFIQILAALLELEGKILLYSGLKLVWHSKHLWMCL
ncbi:hypothetical protein GIB67_016534 [Kingdonia uniflora]|uniref:Uncharacterized protein n=1 Tax=Kingdonia uniflora TaxID=39325 RepID=A0A7J7NQX9_9MAGN|nr:hypothetical protein GIB67_016534 [Kingdonia uniflora]